MLFVSSTPCLGVLLLLLLVVCCGVRRLCGISFLSELVVHRGVCAQLHVASLVVTCCPCVANVASGVGACGIERLDGDWLGLMCH